MKRILTIICLLFISVFFVGCVKNNQKASDTDGSVPKSYDIYSFEVSLNGKLYTLPADFSEFEKNGWTIEDGNFDKVLPTKSMTITIKNGKSELNAVVMNSDEDELPTNKCKVVQIDVEDFEVEAGVDFILPKGIKIGDGMDEVINAYGDPSEKSESNEILDLLYRISDDKLVSFYIDKESKTVTGINIKNSSSNKDKSVSKTKNDNTEVPASVTQYTAPSELTNNIYSFNIKFDDVLYHMPTPIAEFEKNGWKVYGHYNSTIAAKGYANNIILKKENKTISVQVYNDSSKATTVENCLVTEMIVNDSTYKIPLELPNGIKVGSSKADVDSAYADYQVEKDDSDSHNQTYTYRKKLDQSIVIFIKKDTGIVESILIEYIPNDKK